MWSYFFNTLHLQNNTLCLKHQEFLFIKRVTEISLLARNCRRGQFQAIFILSPCKQQIHNSLAGFLIAHWTSAAKPDKLVSANSRSPIDLHKGGIFLW